MKLLARYNLLVLLGSISLTAGTVAAHEFSAPEAVHRPATADIPLPTCFPCPPVEQVAMVADFPPPICLPCAVEENPHRAMLDEPIVIFPPPLGQKGAWERV